MQDLELEILKISRLLPRVGINVIRNFMINVPKTFDHLRVPLTLVHFYKLDDEQNILKQKNENIEHAKLIHDIFPMYSVNKIVKKLSKFGNVPERCKLVVKSILKSREQELNTALRQVPDLGFNTQFGNHYVNQNNENCEGCSISGGGEMKENEELVINFPGCKSSEKYQEKVCDINDPTSEHNLQFELRNFAATKPQQEVNIFDENIGIIESTKTQSTDLNDEFVWNLNTSAENTHAVESSYPQQPEQKYSYDSLQITLDDVESILNEVVDQPVTNFERQHNQPFSIEGSSIHTSPLRVEPPFEHSANSVDIAPQPSSSSIRNFETSEESIQSSSNKGHRSRTPPGEGSYPETLFHKSSRKKLKTNHYKKMPNEVGKFTSADDSYEDVIFFNVPSDEETSNEVMRNSAHRSKSSNEASTSESLNTMNSPIIFRLMEIFPDADPAYIRQTYEKLPNEEKANTTKVYDNLVEKFLSVQNYPKRPPREPSPEVDFDFEKQVQTLTELLPDADPNFLRMKVSKLTREELSEFIDDALETKNYPTLKDYLRKQQLSAQKRQYTVEFSVDNFVKLVPDPMQTFTDPKRVISMDLEDMNYVLHFLKNKFSRINVKTITSVWHSKIYNSPYNCYKTLMEVKGTLLTSRKKVNMSTLSCSNIPLLQELAFIEHETEILAYIKDLQSQKKEEIKRTKDKGLMLTCNCCFDDEIMPDDAYNCSNGCLFCRQCIIKSVEVAFGEGKLVFPCLGDCGSNFTLQHLQNVLPPNLFSKVAQKHAVAEVKAAGMEDLEFCPFCDFATIPSGPPETNKIFVCQNPECLKESCRLCKEQSHVPLRCDEVENDEEVKQRVYIENKMTEALLRKCWKCGISFYKEEGCNKMTCSCGALMCYICGKAVTDYKHFNGIGGDRYDLCPLYSDTNEINQQNVLMGAEAAKKELGVAESSQMKNDPTSDVRKHFQERAKQLPVEPHMEHLERLNGMAQAILLRDRVHLARPRVVRGPVRAAVLQRRQNHINGRPAQTDRRVHQLHPQNGPNCPCEECSRRYH